MNDTLKLNSDLTLKKAIGRKVKSITESNISYAAAPTLNRK